ncbi:MAG: hypothetical protein NZL95_06795 [Chitinophagales bacterium]|nr:hypothetical protein [Chitinophagales bacterium]MDW8428245.1 hypothetical protein [Chitinophagales bacterium]
MKLFDLIFNRNKPQTVVDNNANNITRNAAENGIPEDVFVEKRDPQELPPISSSNEESKGIDKIYSFLNRNYESMGYHDALTNSDLSNMANGIKILKNNVKIIIMKEISEYEKAIKDIDLKIDLLAKAGLDNTVQDLKKNKEKIMIDINRIKEIEDQINNDSGLFENVILSYERGFKQGLIAITKSELA